MSNLVCIIIFVMAICIAILSIIAMVIVAYNGIISNRMIKNSSITDQNINSIDIVKFSTNYIDFEKYINDKINSLVENEINIRIINDRIANTSSITTSDVDIIRDQLVENFYAMTPTLFIDNIVLNMYSEQQIVLMITIALHKKLATYYRIYDKK